MASPTLPFLEPIEALRSRVAELESMNHTSRESLSELEQARHDLNATIREVFGRLTPWQRCQLARHPDRPYTLAYIHAIFTDFTELHGDRRFAEDPAIVAGFAMFDGEPVAVIGHQKGRDTAEKVRRNFGMPRPEGYRKALRIMRLAARFRRPVVTFVDTPGAYPGIDAEERGQAEAIADNLLEMARLPVPIIVVVTGEGGSGGALALGVGDRVLMLENAVYSVISPEGCAAILWKDQARAEDAAKALKLTALDLRELGVIDEILPEPAGGAHMDPGGMAESVAVAIRRHIKQLRRLRPDALVARRYKKFRDMGVHSDR
jgi:acetyl-CoA carboxylase carboxyl transferase subunit alpha